jgi:ABC-type uncharacterized transport system ATPase subunit
VVLDDVFSGLDNTTTRLVFQRLLEADGMLRRDGTTVILATSNGLCDLFLDKEKDVAQLTMKHSGFSPSCRLHHDA